MKALKLTVIACSLAVCAGCTMAPKYERPAAPVAATFPTGEAYKDVMTTASPLPDWKVFITNPKAKKVVEMALANNRDLRVAILNIEKARAAYGIQRSALMPSVAAGLQENAAKTPSKTKFFVFLKILFEFFIYSPPKDRFVNIRKILFKI